MSVSTEGVADAIAQQPAAAHPKLSEPQIASSPVEMSNLANQPRGEEPSRQEQEADTTAGAQQHIPEEAPASLQRQETQSNAPPQQRELIKTAPQRKQSEALGPATDAPLAIPPTAIAGEPDNAATILRISLMLTTGTRHPYRIDEKYLRNRKVEAVTAEGEFDPREMSGYKLKELIWTDWRPEWEPKPASPSAIRLIILGRLLDDKALLKDSPFKLDDINVVHMTVKPADFLDDDDGAAGKAGKSHSTRGQDGEERGAGCRCVIL